jgi:hypothetical protein
VVDALEHGLVIQGLPESGKAQNACDFRLFPARFKTGKR